MIMYELIYYWCKSSLMQQFNVAYKKKGNCILLAMLSKKVVIFVS